MAYQFASGFNNSAGLSNLSVPDFKSSPMRPGVLRAAGDRSKVADGDMMQDWIFTAITHAQFTSLCTNIGFDADDFTPAFVNATVRTKKNNGRTFANYNAVVSLDERVYSLDFTGPVDVVFHLQITGTAT